MDLSRKRCVLMLNPNRIISAMTVYDPLHARLCGNAPVAIRQRIGAADGSRCFVPRTKPPTFLRRALTLTYRSVGFVVNDRLPVPFDERARTPAASFVERPAFLAPKNGCALSARCGETHDTGNKLGRIRSERMLQKCGERRFLTGCQIDFRHRRRRG